MRVPMDQAQSLRRLAALRRPRVRPARRLRTLAVTSGKGGVGKTNVVVNLALALTRLGRRVMVIDADLGLANVDVLLGLNPQYSIGDVLSGERRIADVIVETAGIKILPASSGVSELSNLSQDEKMILLQALETFESDVDTVLIDTAAGISDMVLFFNTAAQDRLVVATGEPTSLTDAYALIKVLHRHHRERRFKLVVNNVETAQEAKNVYRKLAAAADHFLGGLSIDFLGFIPRDPLVNKAVMLQRPLLEAFPSCPAARGIAVLAKNFLEAPVDDSGGNIKFFWRRLVNLS